LNKKRILFCYLGICTLLFADVFIAKVHGYHVHHSHKSKATSRPAGPGPKLSTPNQAIGYLFKCISSNNCHKSHIFSGDMLKVKMGLYRLHKLYDYGVRFKILTQFPKKQRALYQKKLRWASTHLKPLGYKTSGLNKLGFGKGIVGVGQKTAVGVIQTSFVLRGVSTTRILFVILWKKPKGWRIAHIDESIATITKKPTTRASTR